MSEAKQILENIIEDFSPEKFTAFFREKTRRYTPLDESFSGYNDDNFKDGLKLGELSFPEDKELLVCAFKMPEDLSERSGKKAQYEKAKKILKDNQKYSSGIFIFHDPKGNFRFSLVYEEPAGTKRKWSSFRRFTYFASSELTNKTFLQRIGEGDFSEPESIREAFSVEKVTKEFYQVIANWYFWAVDSCEFPKDAEEEANGRQMAVIRMITRLIFIWFMREQNLVPRELFKQEKIENILKSLSPGESTYYKAVLQNLFFATLSTKREKRKFRSEARNRTGYNPDFGNQYVYRYHELFNNPDKLKEYFNSIPFLNGGLFECLDDGRNSNYYVDGFTARKKFQPKVPNFLFFSPEEKVDLNRHYGTKSKTYRVRGLLDILASFNFTIDENSPYDADVALDPELLGRVFENLLASFNPETSTTARKATGSYYTPREIVDYMVDESLKAYFKTHLENIDDKLEILFDVSKEENPFSEKESEKLVDLIENVRIVDPAVGSGAFPMGALNKLVAILNTVDPGNKKWKEAQLKAADSIPDPSVRREAKEKIEDFFGRKNIDYLRKLYLIQRCIYGVDIQQIAVEIAKLRFFISLLVDERVEEGKDNSGIEPLPNLEFKIMQGNSLISEFLGIDLDAEEDNSEGELFTADDGTDELVEKLKSKKDEYLNRANAEDKKELKQEIEDLIIEIFEKKLAKQKADYFYRIKAIEEKCKDLRNKDQRESAIQKEKDKLYKKSGFNLEQYEDKLRKYTSGNKIRPFFPWKLYFAEVFHEKGGFDIVIANPPYVSNWNLKKTEKKNYGVFESATGHYDIYVLFIERGLHILKEQGILSNITSNKYMSQSYGLGIRELLLKYKIQQIINFDFDAFDSATVETAILIVKKETVEKNFIKVREFQNGAKISLQGFEYELVPQNIFADSETRYFRINLTPKILKLTEKINFRSVQLSDICYITKGAEIHTITGVSKNKFIFDKYEKGYKKYLEGKYFEKWFYRTSKYLDYQPDKHKAPISPDVFETPKIIIKNVIGDSGIQALLDTEGFYNNDALINCLRYSDLVNTEYSYIKNKINKNNLTLSQDVDLRYILGIINSRLILWYFNQLYGFGLHFYPNHAKVLPIKIVANQKQKVIINIVANILSLTKGVEYIGRQTERAKVAEYEKQIDQLLYQLYELTPEEIKIVEGKG